MEQNPIKYLLQNLNETENAIERKAHIQIALEMYKQHIELARIKGYWQGVREEQAQQEQREAEEIQREAERQKLQNISQYWQEIKEEEKRQNDNQ